MNKRIDKIDQLDLQALTAPDIRLRFWTGQAGHAFKRGEKITTYRTGIMTPLGDIEVSVWIQAAEALVEREHLQEEVEHITPYIEFPGDQQTAIRRQDLKIRALDAVLSGLYRNPEWVRFVEYNAKYHPELLGKRPLRLC